MCLWCSNKPRIYMFNLDFNIKTLLDKLFKELYDSYQTSMPLQDFLLQPFLDWHTLLPLKQTSEHLEKNKWILNFRSLLHRKSRKIQNILFNIHTFSIASYQTLNIDPFRKVWLNETIDYSVLCIANVKTINADSFIPPWFFCKQYSSFNKALPHLPRVHMVGKPSILAELHKSFSNWHTHK